ncbi:glycosyltransferase family 2 protein [Aestuariivita boseongensis]|uniref:glycosyltransferase family 2 protein n=1 Tax=Aestuariivita boseongensis TaxID=1470562 RepID=UPI0006823F8C|nr:glycosyltransferase family 2 protein [Aestuariivita boseongensis]
MTTWGIVSTIKAPVRDTLRFAAYHLSQGAHRIYIYLDDANEAAFVALNDHPQITPILTDDTWWEKRGRRPVKHQVRQSRNATHCYRRLAKVDWLIHMDADEFLVTTHSIDEILGGLSDNTQCARIRPMEQLSGDPTLFKAFMPAGAKRHRLTEAIYPTYGPYLKAGFLSHLAGKIFVRTGHPDLKLRIHNALIDDKMIEDMPELDGIDLAHAHAKSWDQFLATFRFRLEKGSYRAELAPERPRDKGGLTLHELFQQIAAEDGDAGLRAFFDEVCAATPRLTQALDAHGLLRRVDLALDTHLREHFPEYA